MVNLNRLAALAVAFLVILGILWFGISQYGAKREIAQELGTAKEVISEAVVARKAEVNTNVAQAKQRRSLSDSVVSPGIQKEKDEADRLRSLDESVRLSVLNDRIARANASIDSASKLP